MPFCVNSPATSAGMFLICAAPTTGVFYMPCSISEQYTLKGKKHGRMQTGITYRNITSKRPFLFAFKKYMQVQKSPRIVRRGRLKCFHNGIILIVNCFNNSHKAIYFSAKQQSFLINFVNFTGAIFLIHFMTTN